MVLIVVSPFHDPAFVPLSYLPTYSPHSPPHLQAYVIVEAMMNICGVTFLPNGYGKYEDFNLCKFQKAHCTDSNSNSNKAASKVATVAPAVQSSATAAEGAV
jgi:hypothetical protein